MKIMAVFLFFFKGIWNNQDGWFFDFFKIIFLKELEPTVLSQIQRSAQFC
jgi:hypothetical protein